MGYAIDIETTPDLSLIDCLPEVKAAKNLKDPEKIRLDIEDKKQKQLESMGVNPLFAKIVCIGLWSPKQSHILMGEEKDIIIKFWEIVGKHQRIITYNGKKFDLEVINKRGIIYDIGNYQINKLLCSKNTSGRHVDLMDELCKFGEYEKLDTFCKVYLGEGKMELDYREIPELLKSPNGRDKLAEYCLKDCELTYKLAQKLGYSPD